MTTLREAAQQMLEALDAGVSVSPKSVLHDRLRAALAQQEKEPVAWMFDWDVYDPTNSGPDFSQSKPDDGKNWTPLYTHPPRRDWQSLSEEDINAIWCGAVMAQSTKSPGLGVSGFARAVEAALKEKNQ